MGILSTPPAASRRAARRSPLAKSTTKPRPKSRDANRRPTPRPSRGGGDFPILPVAVGGVLLAVVVALIAYVAVNASPSSGSSSPNFGCGSSEQLAVHYHAHVEVIYNGTPYSTFIPALVGSSPSGGFCWMHTHSSDGVIHVEAPKEQAGHAFTLGEFFKIWDQPLSRSQVATLTVGPGQQMYVAVNGTPYTGDPTKIKLAEHEQIVIDIETSGHPATPPPYTFPQGD